MPTYAGNDTLTTATQNLVVAFNSLNKTQQYLSGQYTSNTYPAAGTSTAVIYSGRSRVVSINIVEAGGTVSIYNSAVSSVIPSSSLLFVLDDSSTLGSYPVGVECSNGIVMVVTGTIQANLTYSVY